MRVQKSGASVSFYSYLARVFALVLFLFVLSAPSPAQAYKVKKGDTLSRLAHKFGVNASKIKRANHLSSSRLKPGMRLKIPGRHNEHTASARTGKRHQKLAKAASASSKKDRVKSASNVYHKVRRGETLYSIARNYSVSVADLKRLNGLGRRSRIRPGKELLVRASETVPEKYTVKRGDTFEKIARRYGLNAEDLMELNEMDSQDLRPGQKIALVDNQPEDDAKTEISQNTGAVPPAGETAQAIAALASNTPSSSSPSDIKGRISELAGSKDIRSMGLKDKVILFAKSMLNIPYRFGGTSFYGIDCSGFVQKVYDFLNIKLPRTAREQFNEGTPVKMSDLAVGDLLFFKTYGPFPSHVGIYIGENLFIHASPKGHRVKIASLDTPYFLRRLIGAKRLIPGGGDEDAGVMPQSTTQGNPALESLPSAQPALK